MTATLTTLFDELVDGAPSSGAYVLNPDDPGLLRSLDRLSAHDASASQAGGASIAAHVAHLRYGLSLLNRWTAGENPFADADWAAAWRTSAVTADEWAELRRGLRHETTRWRGALAAPRAAGPVELNGMLGSIVHLAYHLGAMRQIDPSLRGPRETG